MVVSQFLTRTNTPAVPLAFQDYVAVRGISACTVARAVGVARKEKSKGPVRVTADVGEDARCTIFSDDLCAQLEPAVSRVWPSFLRTQDGRAGFVWC